MQFLKNVRFKRASSLVMVFGLLLAFANSGQADVTLLNGKVSKITNIVDNQGRIWEANMTFGSSFNDTFGPGDPPEFKTPTFWGDEAGATAVANDMEDQLDAYVSANGTTGIDNQQFYVAYERPFSDDRFEAWSIFFNGSQWQEPGVVVRSGTSALASNGFAEFTLTAVPEPTSLALFAGIGGLGMFRRRRCR